MGTAGVVEPDGPPRRSLNGVRAALWSDASLLARVRRGDRRALRTLYGRYVAEVFDFAVRVTGDTGAAAAIVEATFATAYDRLRLGIRPQRVEPWLLGIARGLAIDGAEAPIVSLPPGGGREDDHVELTRRWSETLTPRDYAIVDLYVRRGLSVRELASVTGSGEQALRSRLAALASELESFVASEQVLRQSGRCPELWQLLARVRGADAADVRRAVRLHAGQCDSCRAVAVEASSSLGELAELPAVPLPEELQASIWNRMAAYAASGVRREPRARSSESISPPRPRALMPRRWIAAAAVASACAAGVLAVVLADPFGGAETQETRPGSGAAVIPKLGSSTSVFTPPVVAKTKQDTTPAPTASQPPPAVATPTTPSATKPQAGDSAQSSTPRASTTPQPSATPQKQGIPEKPAASSKPSTPPKASSAPTTSVRTLAWAPVPDAVGYEVVLIRNGREVFKERTSAARVTIPTSGKVDGRTAQLGAGYYRWIVWPIIEGEGKAAKAVVVAAVHLD